MRFHGAVLALSSLVLASALTSPLSESQIKPSASPISLPVAPSTTASPTSTHPSGQSHTPGTLGHSANGLVADDLTSLRDEEWAWVSRAESAGFDVAFAEMLKQYDADPETPLTATSSCMSSAAVLIKSTPISLKLSVSRPAGVAAVSLTALLRPGAELLMPQPRLQISPPSAPPWICVISHAVTV